MSINENVNKHGGICMQELVKLLKNARSTIIFSGAGMSTESGLPDFRSKDRGLWEKFNPEELANVRALETNTAEFTDFYQHRLREINQYQAHAGHHVLAKWEQNGYINGIITQNVDGFHHDAGNKEVMELHGSFRDLHCHTCNQAFTRSEYLAGKSACSCGGTIRPGIVLFGEMLPEEAFRKAEIVSAEADLFIVLGSSLTVSPANAFPLIAKENEANLVIVNHEQTPYNQFADLTIQDKTIQELLLEIDQQLT